MQRKYLSSIITNLYGCELQCVGEGYQGDPRDFKCYDTCYARPECARVWFRLVIMTDEWSEELKLQKRQHQRFPFWSLWLMILAVSIKTSVSIFRARHYPEDISHFNPFGAHNTITSW